MESQANFSLRVLTDQRGTINHRIRRKRLLVKQRNVSQHMLIYFDERKSRAVFIVPRVDTSHYEDPPSRLSSLPETSTTDLEYRHEIGRLDGSHDRHTHRGCR